jgi:lipoprotein-anchoring transpeptidase ErfK/SrfK
MRRSGAVVLVSAAALAAFTASSAATTPASHRATAAAPAVVRPAAPPVVTTTPADGAADVAPSTAVTVTAPDATLTGVTLTSTTGKDVPGTVSGDGHTWTASAPVAYGTAYHLAGTATGPGGSTPVSSSFGTVAAKRLVRASMPSIDEGETVGVAAPLEVRFDRHLSDAGRAAAERALTVTTSVPVQGSWAWLPDDGSSSRVHWRPQQYWPANTTVTVAGRLYGVDLGGGSFGAGDLHRSFTIGRSQIVKADVNSHRLVVVRDGQTVFDVPASYGLDSDPGRVTHNGVHVVMSKAETVLMTNEKYGYKDLPEHWAVRISNNGEFIHANPASTSAQGKRNITHGCINLTTDNAKAYYDTAIFGDPVEVTGSTVPLTSTDGDLYDWTIPWDQWQGMSALAQNK